MTIEIDVEDYIELLEDRRDYIESCFGWSIPEPVWEMAMNFIRECRVDPNNALPKNIVDNLAVNAEWYEFDDVREDGETDEDIISRWKDDSFAIDAKNKYILVQW